MKKYGGSGCLDPRFLDLDTSWRWVVSFTPRSLYPWERAPSTRWIGGWVGPRASLDYTKKRKFLTLPGLKLQPLSCPAHSQSLYQLCYPGSLLIHSIQNSDVHHFLVQSHYFWLSIAQAYVSPQQDTQFAYAPHFSAVGCWQNEDFLKHLSGVQIDSSPTQQG
jgi:hypothetical protein